MGSFHRAWSFSGPEACAYVADELAGSQDPKQALVELAVANAAHAPGQVEAFALDPVEDLRETVVDVSVAELYRLAIVDFMVEAPQVPDYFSAYWALRDAGFEQSTSLLMVYGEELDELPPFYGDAEFRLLWSSLMEWGTSRTGWLPHATLEEWADAVGGVSATTQSGASGLADLEVLLRTGVSRGQDLMIVADP